MERGEGSSSYMYGTLLYSTVHTYSSWLHMQLLFTRLSRDTAAADPAPCVALHLNSLRYSSGWLTET